MASTTTMQGFPYPDEADKPDVPADIKALAQAVELRVAGVYATSSDRDTKVPSPQEGQVAIVKDTNTVWVYFDSAWTQVFPQPVPSITSGTTAPNNATGNNGDLYFQV